MLFETDRAIVMRSLACNVFATSPQRHLQKIKTEGHTSEPQSTEVGGGMQSSLLLVTRAATLEIKLSYSAKRLPLFQSLIHKSLKSKSNTIMHLRHMCIARFACIEDSHTHPADVRLAACASHMIASLRLLHRRRAFRTIFDIKFSLQLCECLVSA